MSTIAVAALLFEAGQEMRWRRADCLARWPTATFALEAAGLLHAVGMNSSAPCSCCGDVHEIEENERPAMHCPIGGTIETNLADLVQVAFDHASWLTAIGAALQLPPPAPILSGVLWRFEGQQRGGWRKQLWLARGLGDASIFDNAARAIRSDGHRARWLLTSSEVPRECGPALGAQLIRFSDCSAISQNGTVDVDLERIVGDRKMDRGKPGRKSKVQPAIARFRQRMAERLTAETLAEEARQIDSGLAEELSLVDRPSVRTIEDAIRIEYANAIGRARPVKP